MLKAYLGLGCIIGIAAINGWSLAYGLLRGRARMRGAWYGRESDPFDYWLVMGGNTAILAMMVWLLSVFGSGFLAA